MAETKKECIFYCKEKNSCKALRELYCSTDDVCRFCKTEEEQNAYEESMKNQDDKLWRLWKKDRFQRKGDLDETVNKICI